MRGTVADNWHRADHEQRFKFMQFWMSSGVTIDAELLDTTVEELDSYVEPLGLAKIWCTKVDVAGMRDYAPGVVASQHAANYRKRK